MRPWHLVTPEFPPLLGGVSEHSRVLATAAAGRGRDVHVWTTPGALPACGLQVHGTLGAFTPADLAQTDAALDRHAAPRDILVQWVPHGFGYRGMNVHFARWLARRAAQGDRLGVMVHEPFVDYFGGSWSQPARALVQRYMTRTVLRSARRVWMSIPGWESRLRPMLPDGSRLQLLPVPGTIPVDRSMAATAGIRRRALGSATWLVGYFGSGGRYAESALQAAIRTLRAKRQDLAFICIGRGSEEAAARMELPRITATGAIDLTSLSHHLSACDVLIQPYVDGVSGRRTTTISALEHGIPVATTFGALSEPFWKDSRAVAVVPADAPHLLAGAAERLLEHDRHTQAQAAAIALYLAHFEPGVALTPLFEEL
jgi:hypothetical protein